MDCGHTCVRDRGLWPNGRRDSVTRVKFGDKLQEFKFEFAKNGHLSAGGRGMRPCHIPTGDARALQSVRPLTLRIPQLPYTVESPVQQSDAELLPV